MHEGPSLLMTDFLPHEMLDAATNKEAPITFALTTTTIPTAR